MEARQKEGRLNCNNFILVENIRVKVIDIHLHMEKNGIKMYIYTSLSLYTRST